MAVFEVSMTSASAVCFLRISEARSAILPKMLAFNSAPNINENTTKNTYVLFIGEMSLPTSKITEL